MPKELVSFVKGRANQMLKDGSATWNADRRNAWKNFPTLNPPSKSAVDNAVLNPKKPSTGLFGLPPPPTTPKRSILDEAWKEAVWKTNPHRRIKSTQLVDATPDEATFKTVYGSDPSVAQTSQLSAAERSSSHYFYQQLTNQAGFNRDACLQKFAAAEEGQLLLVVGHSILSELGDDRILILPGGGTVTFQELHAAAKKRKASCLIISCYSPDISLKSELELGTAMKLAGFARYQVSKAKQQGQGLDIADLSAELSIKMRKDKAQNAVQIAGGGIVAAGVIYHHRTKDSK